MQIASVTKASSERDVSECKQYWTQCAETGIKLQGFLAIY